MREFEGRVAVVTGAASGIGRAFAERFAHEGMKVVLADVEEDALQATVQELRRREFDVLGVLTDVSRPESIEELARRTLDAYGGVHVLCNNAGVSGGGGYVWESTAKDWEWVLGVNVLGVANGIRTFLPIMLERGEEGHVVNTASIAGLIVDAGNPVYGATKHAVFCLSEALYLQLAAMGAKVSASVLCPGYVSTRIAESGRNRPPQLANEVEREPSGEQRARNEQVMQTIRDSMPPEEVADHVLDAVREQRFYILTHPDFDALVRARVGRVLERRNPESPRPPGQAQGAAPP